MNSTKELGMRNHYQGDPYWLTARYPGYCAGCGHPFPAGEQVFRFKNRKLFAESCGCGTSESDRFEELARAEHAYCSGY